MKYTFHVRIMRLHLAVCRLFQIIGMLRMRQRGAQPRIFFSSNKCFSYLLLSKKANTCREYDFNNFPLSNTKTFIIISTCFSYLYEDFHFFACFLVPYHPSDIFLYLFLTRQLFDSCWRVFSVSCAKVKIALHACLFCHCFRLNFRSVEEFYAITKLTDFIYNTEYFAQLREYLHKALSCRNGYGFGVHISFFLFFLPHKIFLIRILRRMRNEIHVGDRDFVETKNVQVICKINYAWTEGGIGVVRTFKRYEKF